MPRGHRRTYRRTGAAGRRREGTGGRASAQEDRRPPGGGPQQSLRQPAPGSAPPFSAAVRAEEETEALLRQTAGYEALAHLEHQGRRWQAASAEPTTIYQLEMGRGGAENKEKTEVAGERHGGQASGGPQGEEEKAGWSGPRRRRECSGGHPEGQATRWGEGRQGDGDSAKAGRRRDR